MNPSTAGMLLMVPVCPTRLKCAGTVPRTVQLRWQTALPSWYCSSELAPPVLVAKRIEAYGDRARDDAGRVADSAAKLAALQDTEPELAAELASAVEAALAAAQAAAEGLVTLGPPPARRPAARQAAAGPRKAHAASPSSAAEAGDLNIMEVDLLYCWEVRLYGRSSYMNLLQPA